MNTVPNTTAAAPSRTRSRTSASVYTPPPLITPPPLVPTPTPDPAAATGANASILFVGNSFLHGKYQPVLNYNADAITDENASLPADAPRAFHPPGEKGPYGGVPGIFKK